MANLYKKYLNPVKHSILPAGFLLGWFPTPAGAVVIDVLSIEDAMPESHYNKIKWLCDKNHLFQVFPDTSDFARILSLHPNPLREGEGIMV